MLASPGLVSRASTFCHVPGIKLLLCPWSLFQPRAGVPHVNPGLLDLHAWLLCVTYCLHQVPLPWCTAWWSMSTTQAHKGPTSRSGTVESGPLQISQFCLITLLDLTWRIWWTFFCNKGLSAFLVQVYWASIFTTIWQLGGPSFSEDLLLWDLMKGAALAETRSPCRTPPWDLFLVHSALRLLTYKPFRELYLGDFIKYTNRSSSSAFPAMSLDILLLLLRSQLCLWGSPVLVRFLCMWPFLIQS